MIALADWRSPKPRFPSWNKQQEGSTTQKKAVKNQGTRTL